MRLLRLIVQRKVLILLLTIFIVIVGGYMLMSLEKELTPSVGLDAASIDVKASNLNVDEVERKVTNPLEQKLREIDGVKEVSSTTSLGHSTIDMTFDNDQGNDLFREVESKASLVLSDVPDVDEINASQEGSGSSYEFILDISDGDMGKMTAFAKDVLKPRLEELPEVREVMFTGLTDQEVAIDFDSEKIDEHNLTISEVTDYIKQENSEEIVGEIDSGNDSTSVRWDTSFQSLEDLKQMQVPTDNGSIDLEDIASISLQPIEGSSNTWKNGTDDLIMTQIGRKDGVSQNAMTTAVRDEIRQIEKEGLVDGFSVNEVIAHADFVDDSINDVTMNILIGGVIAIAVLILFLRNFRATMIIALSIPTSILLTMIAMGVLDYTINLLTLIGLGLGIGMMVDASIVILESIYRQKEQGLDNLEAVLAGIKEVATAIIASALTTIVVFLPIGFIGGDSGKFMLILSIVVAITLISSVIISFTLIPSLANGFMTLRKRKNKRKKSVFLAYYKNIVTWCIEKKLRSLTVVIAFLLVLSASFFLVPKIPINTMPDMFNRYTEIAIDLENGASQKDKETIAEKVHEALHSVDDVEADYVLDMDDVMMANIVMTKGNHITKEQDIITEKALKKLRELEQTEPIRTVERALDGVSGYPVQVNISGDDFSELKEVTNDLQEEIKSIDGIVGVTNTGENDSEIQTIQLNEKAIKDAGVTDLQLKHIMQESLFQGPIGTVEWDDETLRLNASLDDEEHTEESLLETTIPTQNGEENLSSFVTLEKEQIQDEITHKNGNRYISILADVEGMDLGTINKDIQNKIDHYKGEADYSVTLDGDLEEQNQLINDLLFVFGIALFLVFVVMAVQFNHLGQPLIVMSVIPVTMVGVILGLFITQAELNIMSGLGLIILIGIVLNNAILIIDRTNKLRKDGIPVVDSLIQAGESRIRPIFMTTLTTIGGMLPFALATGMSADYQAPLAIVIISGLLFSTLITLVLIPAIYRLFSKDES